MYIKGIINYINVISTIYYLFKKKIGVILNFKNGITDATRLSDHLFILFDVTMLFCAHLFDANIEHTYTQ